MWDYSTVFLSALKNFTVFAFYFSFETEVHYLKYFAMEWDELKTLFLNDL